MIAQFEAFLNRIVTKDIFDSISVISSNSGRKSKYSNEQILRILVLKELLHMSMRDIVKALHSNYSYRQLCLLERDIPSIVTLSYRNAKMNYHALIQSTVILYELESSRSVEITTVDSTIVKPCSDHRAQLQRRNHKYKDRHASWTKSTKKKWEYGYKAHISCDSESSMVLDYSLATAKEHDSTHFKDLIPSLSKSKYVLLDSAYDSKNIYDLILNRTSAIPVIDVNQRKGSSTPNSKDNHTRWIMKNIRIKYKFLYKKRWEIERINSNLKSQFFYSLEYIYYVPHRHYEHAVGLKLLVHNLVTLANISNDLPKNRKVVL